MLRIVKTLASFVEGYRSAMLNHNPTRSNALRVGRQYARNYLHNTSRRWPGCRCELHRTDKHRYNPRDRRGV